MRLEVVNAHDPGNRLFAELAFDFRVHHTVLIHCRALRISYAQN
jgi:hypothetical protein